MNSITVSFAATLLLAHSLVAAKPGVGLVSGVWKKGHFLFEPRPKSSKLMQVRDGGFMVLPGQAAYYLEVEVSPTLAMPYFMRATLENPSDSKKPFVEEALIEKPPRTSTIVHGPAKGLRISKDYQIKVEIFRKKGDKEAIDTLTQLVRSYIDTTNSQVKIKGGMRSN